MSEWEKIGDCWVDSGQVMIVDPCYVLTDKRFPDTANLDYTTVIEEWRSPDNKGQFNISINLANIIRTPWGDGSYPIYAKRDEHKRIMQVMVDFNNEEEEEF